MDNVNIINKKIEDENIKNNIDIISNNENDINANSNNNSNIKPKRKSAKNSKIIQFKIPNSSNNTNTNAIYNNNVNANINTNVNNSPVSNSNNKINNSLFEINTIRNDIANSNQYYKMDEANKNNNTEKTYFEIQNDKPEIKNEKENYKGRSRRRKRNTEDKDKNDSHSKANSKDKNKEKTEKDNKKEGDYDSLNNSITFSHINQTIKELNISKYILDRLSSGQNIFKLIIEKPKKKNREKETDKDKEKEKDNDKENDKEKEKEIGNEIINIKENDKGNENNIKKPKRRGRMKKQKKDEETKMKQEEIKEDSEEDIKITKEDIHIVEEREEEVKQEKEVIILERENKEEMKHEKDEKMNLFEFKLVQKESNNKDSKDINNKKEIEIKEESLKSMEKNFKPLNSYKHNNDNKNEKERNIDIINFNNNMTQEGETIKEITRNDLKHSPNIGVKISQKIIKIPTYKGNELIFNVNNSPSKFLFATNKNSNLETKAKFKKSDVSKRDSFKNINIQIDRQSVEIKGGSLILNDKRNNQNEENIKIKEYFHIIEQK